MVLTLLQHIAYMLTAAKVLSSFFISASRESMHTISTQHCAV